MLWKGSEAGWVGLTMWIKQAEWKTIPSHLSPRPKWGCPFRPTTWISVDLFSFWVGRSFSTKKKRVGRSFDQKKRVGRSLTPKKKSRKKKLTKKKWIGRKKSGILKIISTIFSLKVHSVTSQTTNFFDGVKPVISSK